MTRASRNDAQPTPREPAGQARPGRSSDVLATVAWASTPIWSLGFLSFVPFLVNAAIQHRRQDWAVFAAYLAATLGLILAINLHAPDGAVGGYVIALAGFAAIHTAILFRPGREAAPRVIGPRQRNRAALAQARGRIERRKDARHLVKTNPSMARDLRIGRPDLPREYDDGGLVDVNHVPGTVLSGTLGLTPAEVSDVLAAREKLGRFGSAEEVCAYTSLSPDRVDELREEMIFG